MSSRPIYNLVSEKQNKEKFFKFFTVRQGTPRTRTSSSVGLGFLKAMVPSTPKTEGGFGTTSACYVLCGVVASWLRCSS